MKIIKFSSPLFDLLEWGKIFNKSIGDFYHYIKKPHLFLIICIIFQLAISETFAQNFLPLKVGNAYQIKNFWSYWGPGGTGQTGTNYYAITVVADSVINGDIFFVFPIV